MKRQPLPKSSIGAGQIELLPLATLRTNPKNARRHSNKQLAQIGVSLRTFGFLNPIIIDEDNIVLAGHGRLAAARQQGIAKVPVIRFAHLSAAQKRAYLIADNKIAEQAGWARESLANELSELSQLLPAEGMDISVTGFAIGEIDPLIADFQDSRPAPEDEVPEMPQHPISRRGDHWQLDRHALVCGDARDQTVFARLMGSRQAAAVFTDPPYNRNAHTIGGRGRIRHDNFAFAAGEMSSPQFQKFLKGTLANGAAVSAPGAVHFICMDWRHIAELISVGSTLYGAMLNLVVWAKTNAGQGSFYRSQHELIGVFRVGDGPHRNNVELGRFGRNRSNVWAYAGVNSFGRNRMKDLAAHPTVKPVALVADALLDCTARGDVVLDQFLGSGTTLLAAEKVGRIARGIEYEPRYVDVAIRRWQQLTKLEAVHIDDGRTFDEVAKARAGARGR